MKSSSLILRYVSIAALFSLLLPFNNCGSKFSSGGKAMSLDSSSLSSSSNQNALPNDPAQIIASGAQLYATNCAICHNALDSSTKKGRAATQISAAITSVPVMTGLKSLTSTQISLIAEALNTGTTTINAREAYVCNTAAVPATSSLKLTNREFKGSLFALLDDFSTTLKSDSSLISLINSIPSDTQLEVNYNREQFFLLTSTMLSSYFEASFKASSWSPLMPQDYRTIQIPINV